MRRIIRIFLASSIVQFANERMAIENFIRNISDKFEENYDVKIQPLLCENFNDAYSKIRKQEEYNEKIRNSDLCFFIFFTKAGEYTREEFEVARKKFEETGKPKIYTYFKVINDETAEQSLYDFMDELDKIFGHYYGTFEHIDTVKLRILLNLKLQEMDFLEIKVDGDACVVDGKKTLSLENVSEFANNSIFQELKAELYEVEERYFNLKAKYEKDECSQSEEREYIEIASKRQNLIDAIEEIQKNIFNMSLRMCQDEARGEITLRQKEAYRLFEAGDLEGANNILDFAEIKNDYQRRKAIREAEQKKDAQIFIREGRTKIDILTMMSSMTTRFEEIEVLYDEISNVAIEENVELDVLYDFVSFLYDQNKQKKAIKIGEILDEIYSTSDTIPDFEKVSAFNLLGVVYNCQNDLKKTEYYYLKTIEAYSSLVGENPDKFYPELAIICNNAGVFYSKQGDVKKAKHHYLNAIEIREILAETNPDRFYPELAASYNNIGVLYSKQGNTKESEYYYLKAIETYETLTKEVYDKFSPELAKTYNNVGDFYSNQDDIKNAEYYYLKAIEIREFLAETNPDRFYLDLAASYNDAGNFFSEQGNTKKAEFYYLRAIEITETLTKVFFDKFSPELAGIYNNAGVFYSKQGDVKNAEHYYLKAIKTREVLAEKNSDRFYPDLAASYNDAGNFFSEQGSAKKAEYYHLKAIEIRESLAQKNPDRFNLELAISCYNTGNFYKNQGDAKKTEHYYLRAIGIFKLLSAKNSDRVNSYLADSYNNAGVFYSEEGDAEKAEYHYFRALEIRESLAQKNPDRFNPELAISYFNFALFTHKTEYFVKALVLAKTMPENLYCKMIIDALEDV